MQEVNIQDLINRCVKYFQKKLLHKEQNLQVQESMAYWYHPLHVGA